MNGAPYFNNASYVHIAIELANNFSLIFGQITILLYIPLNGSMFQTKSSVISYAEITLPEFRERRVQIEIVFRNNSPTLPPILWKLKMSYEI